MTTSQLLDVLTHAHWSWDMIPDTYGEYEISFNTDAHNLESAASKLKLNGDNNMGTITTNAVENGTINTITLDPSYYFRYGIGINYSPVSYVVEREVEPEVKNKLEFGDTMITARLYDDGYWKKNVWLSVPNIKKFEIIHDKKTQRVTGLITRFADGTYEKAICADSDRMADGGIDVRQSIMICVFKRMLKCGVENNTSVMNKLLDKFEKQFYKQMDADKDKLTAEREAKAKRADDEDAARKAKEIRREAQHKEEVNTLAEAIVLAHKMMSGEAYEE